MAGLLDDDNRNVLLVIATLIAAVTFQAGVNPPGGVWQEDNNSTAGHGRNAIHAGNDGDAGNAGKAIYASQPGAFYLFLISNTIGLCTSILVIISLIDRKLRFYLHIVTATVAMLVTYASAIFAVTPRDSVRFRYVLTAGALPFIVRGSIYLFYKYYQGKKEETPANKEKGDDNGTDKV